MGNKHVTWLKLEKEKVPLNKRGLTHDFLPPIYKKFAKKKLLYKKRELKLKNNY